MQSSMQTVLQNAKWQAADLTDNAELPRAELVISAYVMNEMTEHDRHKVTDKLWKATEQLLLIVEPGTP